MKILCPKCAAENDTDLASAGMIQCVACEDWFKEKPSASPWAAATPQQRQVLENHLGVRNHVPGVRTRQLAENIAILAALCALGGIIAGLGGALAEHPWICWLGGALISAALWLFLTSQIIHIRANTEK